MSDECDDPKCACHQLAWMREMERVEQEVFPDARPRGEVVVPCSCPQAGLDPMCPIHGSFAGDPTGGNN